MALYFSTPVPPEGKPLPDVIAVHTQLPQVAVGWTSCKVMVLGEDGDRLATASRSAPPTAVAWHGELPWLAIGWKDGQITVLTTEAQALIDAPTGSNAANHQFHQTTEAANAVDTHEGVGVLCVTWSSKENIIIASSRGGVISVWQCNDERKIGKLWSTRSDSPMVRVLEVSRVVVAPQEGQSPAAASAANAGMQDDPSVRCALWPNEGPGMIAIDDSQQIIPLLSVDQAIAAAVWDAPNNRIVAVTVSHTLWVFQVDLDLRAHQLMKRKVSVGPDADAGLLRLAVAAPGLVAFSSGESMVRFFNVTQEAMYALAFPDRTSEGKSATSPSVSHIAVNAAKKQLVAATRDGSLAMWTLVGNHLDSDDSADWQLSMTSDVNQAVENLRVAVGGTVITQCADTTHLLQETIRRRRFAGQAGWVQVAPDSAFVETITAGNLGTKFTLKTNHRIKHGDVCLPQALIFTGRTVEVYALNESSGSVTLLHQFDHVSPAIALHSDGIIAGRGDKVALLNFQLHTTQQISFSETEGLPISIDVAADFVVIVTSKNMMKVCRVGARDLKAIGPTRQLSVVSGPNGSERKTTGFSVRDCRINHRGKRVAYLVKLNDASQSDARVYVYDVDTDQSASFDFATTHQLPISLVWNNAISNSAAQLASNSVETESVLLAVETRVSESAGFIAGKKKGPAAKGSAASGQFEEPLTLATSGQDDEKDADDPSAHATSFVVTLFATQQHGLRMHHTMPLAANDLCLVGLSVPNVIMCTSGVCPSGAAAPAAGAAAVSPADTHLAVKRLHDFEGMQSDQDAKIREALMQFAYYSAIGNMDEAFKAVKMVKDGSVWTNLARLCVKTKRLDVAEVCLANMQDAISARALRESRDEPEPEARFAILAMSLGMIEEAEKLLKRCKRHDLLSDLYVACGKWEVAAKYSETNDRIRVIPVLYRCARHYEMSGNSEQALTFFNEAKCYGQEAPRILFQMGRIDELRALVMTTRDKDMLLWWAQYLESQGDPQGALDCYTAANDAFHVVRILVGATPPDIDRAMEVVTDPRNSNGKGAAFFIARHFEEQRNVQKAVHFYELAGAVKSAIRICRENEMHHDIVSLCLKCGDPHILLETAAYFEDRGIFDKAAHLYRKGGDNQRAIDVCIKGGLYDELHHISESLDSAADPETFISMAEHFINAGQFDKAVQMLVFAKAFNEALQLCMDRGVKLTEDMAEAMTLPKTEANEDEEYRLGLLKKVAKVAKMQESWHLACKKYTQAGERVKAMKTLLRSGDTEKIIFFANHSRNDEIYVLAANYLQSQPWQSTPAIYKNIVAFYTRAKAFDSLAGFYDAAAQVQIDEFRNYDKALMTLREAQKTLDKGDMSAQKKDLLRRRVELVESFSNARGMVKPGEPCPEMVERCQDLLQRSKPDHPDRALLESCIRVGDVYALLIEYYENMAQYENAYGLVEKMAIQHIDISCFLEATLVDRVCKQMKKDASALRAMSKAGVTAAPANYAAARRQDVDGETGYVVDEDVE